MKLAHSLLATSVIGFDAEGSVPFKHHQISSVICIHQMLVSRGPCRNLWEPRVHCTWKDWPNWIPSFGINRYLQLSPHIFVSVFPSFCDLVDLREVLSLTWFSQVLEALWEKAAIDKGGVGKFLLFLVSARGSNGSVRRRNCAAGAGWLWNASSYLLVTLSSHRTLWATHNLPWFGVICHVLHQS